MKDFIHKTLINAGGKDAVSNMLTGAAMGAGANTALGAIQGDFDIIGNATSGALLGAGGGAALRHAGDKYTSGIAAMQKAGKEVPGTFNTNIFTHAVKEESDFMGNAEMMKRAQGMAGMPSAKGATANEPKTGQPSSSESSLADSFRGKEGYHVDGSDVYKTTGKTKEVSMPGLATFDAFGRPKSTGGGTFDMNIQRKMSETEQRTAQRADEIRANQKTERNAQAAKNPVQMNNSLDPSYKPKNVKDLTGDTPNQKIADAEAARRMSQAQARNMSEPAHDKSKSPVTQAQRDQLQAKKTADSVANQRAEEANNRVMSRSDTTPLSGNPVTNSQKDLLKSIKESGLSVKEFNAQKASKKATKNKKRK